MFFFRSSSTCRPKQLQPEHNRVSKRSSRRRREHFLVLHQAKKLPFSLTISICPMSNIMEPSHQLSYFDFYWTKKHCISEVNGLGRTSLIAPSLAAQPHLVVVEPFSRQDSQEDSIWSVCQKHPLVLFKTSSYRSFKGSLTQDSSTKSGLWARLQSSQPLKSIPRFKKILDQPLPNSTIYST